MSGIPERASQMASASEYAKTPRNSLRSSTRLVTARHRIDFVASRMGSQRALVIIDVALSSRASRSTTAKGGIRLAVAACSLSATMPIHSPLTSRQHLFRTGNTSGVSANRLDNTRAAESCHDQGISSGERIRHRRRA